MKGRLWAALALLFALSTGLAGCIEGLQSMSEDDNGITAKEDQDLAANAAQAWNPQAYLVGALTLESQDVRSGVPTDVEVGDGQSAFWYYAYGAPETDETRLFRVTADGRVTIEERLPGILGAVQFTPAPAGEWPMDSDAALAAVKAHAVASPVFGGANLSVLEGVAYNPEHGATCWAVAGFSDAGFVVAFVDPKTGEVTIHETEMPEIPKGMPPMVPLVSFAPPLVITDEGALEGDEMEKSWTFDATKGMDAVFAFEAETYQAFDTFEWEIIGPEGSLIAWDTVRAWGPMGGSFSYAFDFELEKTGEHTLVLRASNTIGPLWTPIPPQPIDYWFELIVGYDVAAPEPDEA
jgi:hypothetical protein